MPGRNSVLWAILLLVAGGIVFRTVLAQPPVRQTAPVQQAAPAQQAPLKSVLTESLGKTHQLVGALGLPLGEMFTATVRTQAARDKGYYDQDVLVSALAGRKLDRPISMPAKLWPHGDIAKLKYGEELTVRAYETGGMVGIPGQALKETVIVQSQGLRFETWVVVVKTAP